ncbi:MAG: Lon protease 2 [Alphaproteobacteria bacterium MarineAlpha2_Bin1]|nr:MAG: Lon protease 2 [Alphaproteobacteria bacterium MarineAlpha2_Bin1]
MHNFTNTPSLKNLPRVIPIFPLQGTILLPGTDLPLHVFEERYKNMFSESLKGERIIGMIQPLDTSSGKELYKIGCVGRITAFKETVDGRYYFTLNGICRFELINEFKSSKDFRLIEANYENFNYDYDIKDMSDHIIERGKLIPLLKKYFTKYQIDIDIENLESFSDDAIIQSLSMSCPFEPREKQLLLEAKNITERANLFYSLVEISVNSQNIVNQKSTIQ